MKKYNKFILAFFIMFFSISLINAMEPTHVISNSENWEDVYSSIHYANLKGLGSDFLTSTSHGKILLTDIPKSNEVRIITSRDNPYVFNYPSQIKNEGFQDSDEIKVKNANIELIEELPEIENFIIVSDSYGYNAMAVIPYAIKKKSWVFLASNSNVEKIDSILSDKNINELLIYGYVEREVSNTLQKYNPKIINEGDKFKDNIKIVEEYLKLSPTKQCLLTNGEFIEKELMLGNSPILFTGNQNVPDQIKDYLKNSPLEIGVLIGNDLMGAATNIRRSTGISVMVKFARGARQQTNSIAAVEGLDIFPLPTPTLNLKINSIKYNLITKQLEVTYKSNSNTPLYFKGTITINTGTETTKVGDTESIFLAPGNYKTMIYPVELTENSNLKAEIYTIYGETEKALDYILEETQDIDTIEVLDKCELEIKEIEYNKQNKEFKIKLKNIVDTTCWANAEIEKLIINSFKTTISTESPIKIEPRKTKSITISQELLEEDFEENKYINLKINYGEKEENLVKALNENFELKISTLTIVTYGIIFVSAIFIFIIIIFIKKRRDKDEDFL